MNRFNIKFENISNDNALNSIHKEVYDFLSCLDMSLSNNSMEEASSHDIENLLNSIDQTSESIEILSFKRNGSRASTEAFETTCADFLKTVDEFSVSNSTFLGLIMDDENQPTLMLLEKEPIYISLIEDIVDFINTSVKPSMAECHNIYTAVLNGNFIDKLDQFTDLVTEARRKVSYLTKTIHSIENLIENYKKI